MSTYQDRLRWAMKRASISTQALADALGASYQAIRKAENGLSKSFSAANNEKAAEILHVSARWLATGEGPRERQNDAETPEEELSMHFKPILACEYSDDLPEDELVYIPPLDVNMSAMQILKQNPDDAVLSGRPIAFRANWIRKMHLKPQALKAFLANNDSMAPRIQDKDLIVIDTSQKDVLDGKVYVLYYNGGEHVKRLFRKPGGGLFIRSDNPNYPNMHITQDEMKYVRIIGRVVHVSGEGGL